MIGGSYRVAVDAVVFGARPISLGERRGLEVLLVQRGVAPFKAEWALPGGLVLPHENLETAVRRELREEAGIEPSWLEQLYTFGEPGRDPRERAVTIAWLGLVRPDHYPPKADTDAADARWWPISALPPLAFDHAHILAVARERLEGKVRYRPIGFDLLPAEFTLSELQFLYETILQRGLDKRNFRRKIGKTGLLLDTGRKRTGGAHRAPALYRFERDRYQALEQQGYLFEI
ncbi:MAG: NUDIX hydrolase [Deltaproteobacteria bacterium]|nr:NUDIX hydrolase [Deltaproteobacteria bacterium]HCH62382.1 NUDIX hydrolase [Deltaproteobacteria bacterium]